MNFNGNSVNPHTQMIAAINSNDVTITNKYQGRLSDAEWSNCLVLAAQKDRGVIVSNLVYDKDVSHLTDAIDQAIAFAKENKNEPMENALNMAKNRKQFTPAPL